MALFPASPPPFKDHVFIFEREKGSGEGAEGENMQAVSHVARSLTWRARSHDPCEIPGPESKLRTLSFGRLID